VSGGFMSVGELAVLFCLRDFSVVSIEFHSKIRIKKPPTPETVAVVFGKKYMIIPPTITKNSVLNRKVPKQLPKEFFLFIFPSRNDGRTRQPLKWAA
jgi:hypothetical protein